MKRLIPILILFFAVSAYTQEPTATVTAANTSLRGTPAASGKVLAKLDRGARVEVLTTRGNWHLVQSTEYAGWLPSDTIKLDAPAPVTTPVQGISVPNPTNSVPPGPVPTLPPSSTRDTSGRVYTRGPRGGCHYINSSGKKTYVDKSLCN